MEATAPASTTGSRTIADLIEHSAVEHAEQVAVRYTSATALGRT